LARAPLSERTPTICNTMSVLLLACAIVGVAGSENLYGVRYTVVGTAQFETQWVRINAATGNIAEVAGMDSVQSSYSRPAVMTPDATTLIAPAGDLDPPPGAGTHLHVYGKQASHISYDNDTFAMLWDSRKQRLVAITTDATDTNSKGQQIVWIIGVDIGTKATEPIASFFVPESSVYGLVASLDVPGRSLYAALGDQLVKVGLDSGKVSTYPVAHQCGKVMNMWWDGAFGGVGGLLALTSPGQGNLTLVDASLGGCKTLATLPLAMGSGVGGQAALSPGGKILTVLIGPQWAQTGVMRVELSTSRNVSNVSHAHFAESYANFAWIGYQSDFEQVLSVSI